MQRPMPGINYTELLGAVAVGTPTVVNHQLDWLHMTPRQRRILSQCGYPPERWEEGLEELGKLDEEERLARKCEFCLGPRTGRRTIYKDKEELYGPRVYGYCKGCARHRQKLYRQQHREELAMYRQLLRLAARDDAPGAA